MMSESLAMLPVPNDGWLMPQDAEAWLRERAEAYAALAAEGVTVAERLGGADTWAMFGFDVATYTAACVEAVFSGRMVRLGRDEGEAEAARALADLVTRYGEWLQHHESGLHTAEPAYAELCAALRAHSARPRRPEPVPETDEAEAGAEAVREGA